MLYLNCKPLFFYFYESNSPLLTHYYYFLLPITILLVYMNVLESYARVHLRIVVPAVVREVVLKLSNSALALLYGLSVLSFDQLVDWRRQCGAGTTDGEAHLACLRRGHEKHRYF